MASFLSPPPPSAETDQLYAGDLGGIGFVMNLSELWAHWPHGLHALSDLLAEGAHGADLTFRQRGVIIAALAGTLGDSYCSLAWGNRLAGEAGPETAAAVLVGDDSMLDAAERALARWARLVAGRPNDTSPAEVDALRAIGYDDRQIFAITVFIALRVAFSNVNDALGARPDRQLHDAASPAVRDAVSYGRPVADDESRST